MSEEAAKMLSRFQGALVGAVVGDCLGSRFETLWDLCTPAVVKTWYDQFQLDIAAKKKTQLQEYTDDTAMARQVATSLIDQKGFDAVDMAQRFSREYFAAPERGYGGSVPRVFGELKAEGFADPFGPAGRMFEGAGSYGNGGAMRVAPVGLLTLHAPRAVLMSVARDATRITHTNRNAITGAVLQAGAVRHALSLPGGQALDPLAFWTHLQSLLSSVQEKSSSPPSKKQKRPSDENSETETEAEEPTYDRRLEDIKTFLTSDPEPTQAEVIAALGHDVSALGSVPAALFSFLRSSRPVPDMQADSPFARTFLYAISLGGDTDTIASMACAIAGAYYGLESIPPYWREISEGADDAMEMAGKMYELWGKEVSSEKSGAKV